MALSEKWIGVQAGRWHSHGNVTLQTQHWKSTKSSLRSGSLLRVAPVLCESGLMMLRLVFLLLIVALAIAPQQAPTKAAGEDGFASLINEPDLTEWDGNRHAWKLDDGILTGRSDGSSPAILVVSGREFGDLELRFEARVHRGAVRVKMHGPGPGPLGVALEINSATVEWFTHSASSFVVAYNRPDEWKEYRVVVGDRRFKVWQNGIPSALDLSVSHLDAKGALSLHLSEGKPSEVALRRIRIRE